MSSICIVASSHSLAGCMKRELLHKLCVPRFAANPDTYHASIKEHTVGRLAVPCVLVSQLYKNLCILQSSWIRKKSDSSQRGTHQLLARHFIKLEIINMKLAFVLLLCSCISASMQQQSSMYDFWSYMPSWSSWRMPYYNPASYFYGPEEHQQQQPQHLPAVPYQQAHQADFPDHLIVKFSFIF